MVSEKITNEYPKSVWFGDKRDGIELRYQGPDVLDEVVLYIDGRCALHIEQMSDTCYWMSILAKQHEAHVNIFSKNGKSYVTANAEGWPTTPATQRAYLASTARGKENTNE